MKPYKAKKLPMDNLDWIKLLPLITEANREISRYDGFLSSIINPSILLAPLLLQEAVLSSRIEGTQATIGDVLKHEAGEKFERIKEIDIEEIKNYRKALLFAAEYLKNRPITLNMIKEVHSILLFDVRGHNKSRGNFRTVQNWIGQQGNPIEKAKYIPPSPLDLNDLLDNWEKYINNKEKDFIVQTAIMHAQFEIIHPFIDGNGRVGRILVPIFLSANKLLSLPTFYISEYLEANREQYYNTLNEITKNDDWQSWIDFFLKAVIQQAIINTEKARNINTLYEEMKKKITNITHSQYQIAALDTIFCNPIFTKPSFIRDSKIPKPSARRIIDILENENIIEIYEKSSGRKAAKYVYSNLLDITN